MDSVLMRLRPSPWPGARCAAALALGLLLVAPAARALSLSEALRLSVERDPVVPVSLAQYDAEREAGAQERGTLRPSVGVRADAQYVEREVNSAFFSSFQENFSGYSAALEVRQPLFRLDWFARRDRARARDALADSRLADRTQQLLRRVAERYFAVLIAQDALSQAQAEARALSESLDDTRKRYDVELVAGTDLKEAQARSDLAQARLLSAESALQNAQDALDETTGQGRSELPDLTEEVQFPPLTPDDVAQWVATARESNPRLRSAREQVTVARSNLRSRRSEGAPTLDAVASLSRVDNQESRVGQLADNGQVGVELNIPLYTGGITSSRVREAQALLRGAETELARLESDTERETRQLFRQVQTAYVQVQALSRALRSAEAAEQATRNGYEAGTRTISDVLDAQSRSVQARRERNQTRYQLLLSLLQLKQTVGVLNERDFLEIDRLLQPGATP